MLVFKLIFVWNGKCLGALAHFGYALRTRCYAFVRPCACRACHACINKTVAALPTPLGYMIHPKVPGVPSANHATIAERVAN